MSFLSELSAREQRPLKLHDSDREPWVTDTQAASVWFSEWFGYLRTLSSIETPERLALVRFIRDYLGTRFEALQPCKGEGRH